MTSVLNLEEKYWIYGSVLLASINRTSYRRINDIDVYIEENTKDKLVHNLKLKGYSSAPITQGFWKLFQPSPISLRKSQTIIDLFPGTMEINGGLRFRMKYGLSFYLPSFILAKNIGLFLGVPFRTVNPSAAAYVNSLQVKPKHNKDTELLRKYLDPLFEKQIRKGNGGLWFHRQPLPILRILSKLLSIQQAFSR